MSQGRIEKLKQLLRRVEHRRAEPRLVAVGGVRVLESANTNLATAPEPAPPPRLREAPPLELARPPTPIEEAFAERAPSSMPPPAPRRSEAPAARAPSEAPAPTSLPPPAREAPVTELKPPTSTVPPAAQETAARAQTEVLPPVAPVPTRIAPAPAQPFDSAVQVTSSPRIDQPKTFGELLELSLSLRPRGSTPSAG